MKYEEELKQKLMDRFWVHGSWAQPAALSSDCVTLQQHLISLGLSFFLYRVGILPLNLEKKKWSKDKKMMFLNFCYNV